MTPWEFLKLLGWLVIGLLLWLCGYWLIWYFLIPPRYYPTNY